MKEIIYIDDYFGINFLMDLTALLLTALILSEKAKAYRFFLAAALGAFLSLVPILTGFPAWASAAFRRRCFPFCR